MFLIAVLVMVLGLLVGWSGYLGFSERLPRDRGAGVRTPATMRSDEAFRVGNKVAGLPTMAAGLVGLLAGAAGLFMPSVAGVLIAAGVAVVGTSGLVVAGGLLGHRAAAAVSEPEPGGCSSCACGSGCLGAASAQRHS